MNLTLVQWLEIDKAARDAHAALKALDSKLNEMMLRHIRDEKVIEFCTKVQDRLSDASFIAISLQLQQEWKGVDSSEPNNFGWREPNAVGLTQNIPHAISESRGVPLLDPKPKQIARVRGQIVARTYDIEGHPKLGRFSLVFVTKPKPSMSDVMYRDNYDTLKGMVKRFYPEAIWQEAAIYADA